MEIRPEPEADVREAIVLALERLERETPSHPAYSSRWRIAGFPPPGGDDRGPWVTAGQHPRV